MEHPKNETREVYLPRVRQILRETPLIDGHNDMPWRYIKDVDNDLERLDFSKDTSVISPTMCTDIPRMRLGLLGGQFWGIYIPEEWPNRDQAALRQIRLVHDIETRFPDDLEAAITAEDVARIHRGGRIASLIGVEGAYCLEGSPDMVEEFYRQGARYITLACAHTNDACDGALDKPRHGGISQFGRAVVREMNRLGIMVDLSHTSEAAMKEAIRLSSVPVIFTHSNARAICNSPRNSTDEVLEMTAEKGGITMATFVPIYVSEETREWSRRWTDEKDRRKLQGKDDEDQLEEAMRQWEQDHPRPEATLDQVADHIDHIRRISGIEHVGIGSDFGGYLRPLKGLEDATMYPELLAELMRRGYSDNDIRKVAGENILRIMDVVARKKGAS